MPTTVAESKKEHKKEYKRKLLMKTPEVDVWLVKGKKVRKELSRDFFQGSHGFVPWHERFIPVREVWIDDTLHKDDRLPTILHEVYERDLMKKGVGYDKAHQRANMVEAKAQKSLAKVRRAMVRHGAKPYWCTRCKDWHNYKERRYRSHLKYNHTG